MSRNCFLISRIIYVMVVWFCHLYRISCIMWCRIYVQYKHASVMSSRHILNTLSLKKLLNEIYRVMNYHKKQCWNLGNNSALHSWIIQQSQLPWSKFPTFKSLRSKNTWTIFIFNPLQTNVPIKVIRIKPRTWFNPFKHHIKAWRRIRRWYWL